ncbi:hypothetical protein BCR41DRAFT_375938 [Lobosporangium transversale]|uniref:Uncharacterized protein n=1 Tax=Lobosporangium transversale TaxID=64571 RepID=A0A1Y2G5C5_9FUNG|nr:hypothetical protein BCR41DRAFT_375938 [Lobosporangium transversale]ORY94352.1 hypothetical protein BCR41DRAFT_375938 [Lobosporangium transversale]|eukprot:XP_021875292.1 hypothetical protein BCR41DRAFT_375938 [Lobosporangium transversale]
MSITQDETIASLQQQLATLASQFADLQRSKEEQDPAMETPTLIQTYKPTQDDLERFPFLEPKDPSSVFQQDITDEELWEQFRQFPKNIHWPYEPPKLPSAVSLKTHQKHHDQQLRALQKRLLNLTRPLHLFAHQITSMEIDDKMGTDYWYDRQDQQHAT